MKRKEYTLDWFTEGGWVVIVDILDENDNLIGKENIFPEVLRKMISDGEIQCTSDVWFHSFSLGVVNYLLKGKFTTNH